MKGFNSMSEKKSFIDKMQDLLGPLAQKLNQNRYILSIRDGMLAYMPFTVIASIFLIIAFFPIPAYIDFMTSLFGENWQTYLGYVSNSSLDIGGLLVVITISNSMAKHFEVDQLQTVLTSVVSFILLTPQTTLEEGSILEIVRISSQAIFMAIIVGIVSVIIFKTVIDKEIKIKMPDTVPPAVSGPFEALIPALAAITFFLIVRLFLEIGLQTDAFTLVANLLSAPLTMLGSSLLGTLIIVAFEQMLWFFGIHGASIVNAVMEPIWLVLEDQNRLATLAGETGPNIITRTFIGNFSMIGVMGAVIAIVIVAKSKQYKEVGKIALIPYFFNIGEPTLFGIPLMLNAIYFIPLIFSRITTTLVAYISFYLGIVPVPTGLAIVPWTTPPIISGYLITSSIRGSILQIVLIIIATLIWIPFVKVADRQIYKQESQVSEAEIT